MNTKFAVETMARAVNDVIVPKFRTYVEIQKNSPTIKAKIKAKIDEIEATEDIVAEIQSNVDFKEGDSISLNGLYFWYNTEKEELVTNNKVDIATNTVYSREGLTYSWRAEELLRSRILAIIDGLWKITFPEALKIVEDQIDFAEFIKLSKDTI